MSGLNIESEKLVKPAHSATYRVTVSLPVSIPGIGGDSYLLGAEGKALSFSTVKEALIYLARRNWTTADLTLLDFNIEEAEAGT